MRGRKVLILGGSGFVGKTLFERLGTDRALATYRSNAFPEGVAFDAGTESIRQIVGEPSKFSHAVILFGHTNPDACVKAPTESRTINVDRVAAIAEEARDLGMIPVFASSESVFDGETGGYKETDPARPVLLYGAQKLEAERLIAQAGDDHLILRLGRVYGTQPGDGTLFSGLLESLKRNQDMICATDQVFSPVHVEDVVSIVTALINGGHRGLFHVAGPDALSRRRMLDMLLSRHEASGRRFAGVVRDCKLRDLPTLEPRPRDISMDSAKAIAATGINPRPLSEGLDALFTEEMCHA